MEGPFSLVQKCLRCLKRVSQAAHYKVKENLHRFQQGAELVLFSGW
jgi:hypothetical protein